MELVVVLALLALAAAIVAPAVGRAATDVRARSEAAAVAAFLRGARELAATRREVVQVAPGRDDHTLLLRQPATHGSAGSERARTFTARLRLEPGAGALSFLPDGMSSGGRITLDASGRRSFTVVVDPLTGRVTTRATR